MDDFMWVLEKFMKKSKNLTKIPDKVLVKGEVYISGWQIGRDRGKQKIGNRYFNRLCPQHLKDTEQEKMWYDGYEEGLKCRKTDKEKEVLLDFFVRYYDSSFQVVEKTVYGNSRNNVLEKLKRTGVKGRVLISRKNRSFIAEL